MFDLHSRPARPQPGKVWLVGAGPGAGDLITLRGASVLAQAELVLYDALVTADVLAHSPQAILVCVGKRSGQRSMAQTLINQQIVDSAWRFERVVRLKGGDPMMFGRADEELRALEAAGIEYEIVPGISTAFAAAAAVRQPLTKRGVARSVAFFTSSTAPGESDQVILPGCDTLVQYMGGSVAIDTARRLIEHGKSPATPVVAVENVSRSDQRVMRMTLAEMAQGIAACSGPVLVMIGEALRERKQ
jgi:uroporphyrin-III C-methyltransferase